MRGKVVLSIKDYAETDRLELGGYRGKGAVTDKAHAHDAYFEALCMHENKNSREYGRAKIYAAPPEEAYQHLVRDDLLNEFIVMDDEDKEKERYIVLFVFTKEKILDTEYLPQGIYEILIAVVDASDERNALGRAKQQEDITEQLRKDSNIRAYVFREDELEKYRLSVGQETQHLGERRL